MRFTVRSIESKVEVRSSLAFPSADDIESERSPYEKGSDSNSSALPAARPRWDLLRMPLLGAFLRWRRARIALQLTFGALALVLILHGLFGPQLAPKNLATLLVWVHWRGALVIALLVVGNLFCMGCPLLLPRELARKLRQPMRAFPRFLRHKWLGLVGFGAVLFAYEWLDLWASPRATAIVLLGYFAVALLVDAFFRGAPFCKWVCPIGQFNFVASTFSPFEVRVRDKATCSGCATKDCIRGVREAQPRSAQAVAVNPASVVGQRGCELGLFLPSKVGNLDCTFCLDCVHACPSDNVAIAARVPGEELALDPVRSGLGRISGRTDLACLVLLFTFGSLLNAFGMVAPVYAFQRSIAQVLGTNSDFAVLAVLFLLGLVVVPVVCIAVTAKLAHGATGGSPFVHARRFVFGLAPLGFGVWLAHYSFHFLTGLWTFVPVAQKACNELGITLFGSPSWGLGGLHAAYVWPIEVGFVALGIVGALTVTWRLAQRDASRAVVRTFAPWAVLELVLGATALWLLAQPMEMRGTFL